MDEHYKLNDIQEYLHEATDFLAQHAWIYNAKNTDLFVSGVLENIPSEWVQPLLNLSLNELKRVPYNFSKDEWPVSLQAFVQNANRLAEFRYGCKLIVDSVEPIKVPDFIRRNTPSKKLNEVMWMSAVIENVLRKYGCGTVLDFGSGLGYLDQILHHNFGITTIGFESIRDRSLQASHRIQQGNCTQNMHHINSKMEDTEDCLRFIRTKLSEISTEEQCICGTLNKADVNPENIMMIGLHSCGNLTQDMMKLFVKLQEVKIFLCVGCCYHQISLCDFPMSNSAKRALSLTQLEHPYWRPCTTGLRLGCQTTRTYWEKLTEEEHNQREKCLFYRAALQKFLRKENLMWRKPKRHLRKERDVSSFDNFVFFAFQNFPWSASEKEQKSKTFLKLCTEKEHLFPYIRILNLLQVLLQPIWEGLVIADRLSYFLENSVSSELYVMCDEQISPRNVLLFGIK